MRCFFHDKLEIGTVEYEDISDRERNHIFKVMRGKNHVEILLINGKGIIANAVIDSKRSLNIYKVTHIAPPNAKVHLYVAPPRKNQMEQLLKQCAELGVWSISPIITEHSVAKPEKESTKERMEVLLLEACKQAHNPFIPILNHIKTISDIAAELSKNQYVFFGATSKGESIPDLRNMQLSDNIAWIVGPEGGFSSFEEQFLEKAGAQALHLGNWVMRVETAAIVGAAVLYSHCETTRELSDIS